MMGRQIRSAVYYWAKHDEDEVPFFYGQSDGMSFVTSAPQSRGGTGLAVVNYRLVDGRLVVEERTSFTPHDLYAPSADVHVERAVLLEGFSSFRLEYLPKEEFDIGWADKWDARDEDTLPAAVRITIEGLPFFGGVPWVREIPLITMAAGWGTEDYQEPPEEEDEADGASSNNQADDNDTNDEDGSDE
jgi:hypothetical protein